MAIRRKKGESYNDFYRRMQDACRFELTADRVEDMAYGVKMHLQAGDVVAAVEWLMLEICADDSQPSSVRTQAMSEIVKESIVRRGMLKRRLELDAEVEGLKLRDAESGAV